jgi:acyl-homoserine lactone acylase PvdQ
VHPLFLAGILASESGFGTVSFARWWNNPMAYHWENALMPRGTPRYDAPLRHNRRFRDLREAFAAFSWGVNRPQFVAAARTDLFAFHCRYVGYEAEEWMRTLSRLYRDVLGVEIGPHVPVKGIGQYIYLERSTSSFPGTVLPSPRVSH